jgi:hypothetical protein
MHVATVTFTMASSTDCLIPLSSMAFALEIEMEANFAQSPFSLSSSTLRIRESLGVGSQGWKESSESVEGRVV